MFLTTAEQILTEVRITHEIRRFGPLSLQSWPIESVGYGFSVCYVAFGPPPPFQCCKSWSFFFVSSFRNTNRTPGATLNRGGGGGVTRRILLATIVEIYEKFTESY